MERLSATAAASVPAPCLMQAAGRLTDSAPACLDRGKLRPAQLRRMCLPPLLPTPLAATTVAMPASHLLPAGEEVQEVEGQVTMEDVHFSYPSAPGTSWALAREQAASRRGVGQATGRVEGLPDVRWRWGRALAVERGAGSQA